MFFPGDKQDGLACCLLESCSEALHGFSVDRQHGRNFLFWGLSQLPALFYYFGYWENVGKEDQAKGGKERGRSCFHLWVMRSSCNVVDFYGR